jgi:hypothetical protein
MGRNAFRFFNVECTTFAGVLVLNGVRVIVVLPAALLARFTDACERSHDTPNSTVASQVSATVLFIELAGMTVNEAVAG